MESSDWMNCQPDSLCRGLGFEGGNYGLFGNETGQGFGGPADANRDLLITADELFAYLVPALKTVAESEGKTQTPIRLGRGAE